MFIETRLLIYIIIVSSLYQSGICVSPVWTYPTSLLTLASISEDTPVGTSIITLSASDAEGDPLTYSIISQSVAKFILDGRILRVNQILDRETDGTTNTFGFRVQESSIYNYYQDITVYLPLTDVNDNPPIFSPAVYTVSVSENTGSGVSLVDLTCSDADSGNNAVYSVSIISGDDATNKFTLSGTQLQTTSNALDYESRTKYTLVVTATEIYTSTPQFTGTAYIFVTVIEVNEFTPSIDGTSPSPVTVAENVDIGTTVCRVVGSDQDDGDKGGLQYSITGGAGNNGVLAIDKVYGYIYTVRSLDYETFSSHVLHIQILDAVSPVRSSTYILTVTVTDVNDKTPSCTQYFYSTILLETASVGTTVTSLNCDDSDTGTTLSYSIASGNTDDVFTISPTGVVTTTKVVDFDAGTTSYLLQAHITDGSFTSTVTVAVTVSAIDETTPTFATSPITVSIREDTPIGTEILTYDATDSDSNPHDIVEYSINSVTNSGTSKFIIDKLSGRILLAQEVDYEMYTDYVAEIIARDGGSSTVTGTVTISLLDVNDNRPVCSPTAHATSVDENVVAGHVVVSDLNCSDSDSGSFGNLNYVFTRNPDNKFQISENSGVYTITVSGTFDYESTSFYQLEIVVSDGGSPSLSTSVAVTVYINDINEASPVFTSSGQYSVTLSEDGPVSSTLVIVSASDTDTDDIITYGFNTTYSNFYIDKTSGVVLLRTSLDYETVDSHILLVTASDGANVVTGTVSINVTDVNEVPVFTSIVYSITINENQPVGTSIVQVNATDSDFDEQGTVKYNFYLGIWTSFFSINSSTGIITTLTEIDYETRNIYTLEVEASDGGSPSLTSTCLVIIILTDLNDNAPIFEPESYTLSISESTATSSTIGRLTATDVDTSTNNNNVFQYTLTTTTPFSVTNVGEITTNTALDRENTASYELVVVATDQGSPALTTSYTLTISLIDANDNPPNITETFDITISENTVIGAAIFNVQATDPDYGENGRLSYNITAGNDNNEFTIDNGYVRTTSTFDRESVDLYNLEITVVDNGSASMTTSITATVTISDYNDNYPSFVSNYTFSIDENATVTTSVGTLNATDDDDGSNSELSYSIVGYWVTGTVNPFTINSSSGIITTIDNLDRESFDTYYLWCRVQDSGSPLFSSDINITITINDINDNTPVFSDATYTGSVVEASINGTSILTIAATDADLGENSEVYYIIDVTAVGGTEAEKYFAVNATSGVIYITGETDRETNSSFSFYVNAVDNGTSSLTTTGAVEITITDINDNIPVFTTQFYNTEIPYLVVCNSYITTLTATDDDIGNNADISFYNAGSDSLNFDTYFILDSTSGQLSLKATITTDSKYLLTFGARDGGTPQLTTSILATVRVDTFTPSEKVITFFMSITRSVFVSLESTFLSKLTVVFRESYTDNIIKRWCIEDETSTSIKVHLYILTDNTTNLQTNTGVIKTFMTASTAQAVVASSNGTPSDRISGSDWTNFSITKVLTYNYTAPVTDDTPWIETVTAIIVVSFACVFGLIILAIVITVIVRKCKEPDRPLSRQTLKGDLEEDGNIILQESDDVVKENDALTTAGDGNKEEVVSVVLLNNPILPQKLIHKVYHILQNSSKPGANQEKDKIKNAVPVVSGPIHFKLDIGKFKKERYETVPRKAETPAMISPKKEEVDVNVVNNRKFDGKAVDPATGRVYEYNTKTHERRWITPVLNNDYSDF